jgi:hypothetical protein
MLLVCFRIVCIVMAPQGRDAHIIMNWGIKDENMKNRLWSERCRKDLAASEKGPRAVWSVQQSSMHVLSRDVNDRDKRFLNGGPSLLASLSRFVAENNKTPQAEFVRSFTGLRKEKLSRPSLRAHGNRAASAVPEGDTATTTGLVKDGEYLFPVSVGDKPHAIRPSTAADARPAAPATPEPSTVLSDHDYIRPDFRRPLSAMMFMSKPKWRHPVATSDVYGWQPTVNTIPETDRRFQHPLSSTDVTRMGSMGKKSK